MTDKPTSWMPFWLATYIFTAGIIAATIAVSMFCTFAYEAEMVYTWQFGVILSMVSATPWVWYFTYLGYKYFDNIPRLYYLLVAAPFFTYSYSVLSRETLYAEIIKFGENVYYIRIGWEGVVPLAVAAAIGYELITRRKDYTKFIARNGGGI